MELWFLKGHELFGNLEADPRYNAFLRKMNLSMASIGMPGTA
jgi:hypothetical protein